MNKYHVYLADNYTKSEPFTTAWSYELIGDKLRAEFDEWFKEQEKLAGADKVGGSKRLFKGEYIKKFMVKQRINLVDDPVTGSLKSVFVLRKDEKKLIDGRAKVDLDYRFGYRVKKDKDGKDLEPLGFMKFDLVEGSEDNPESINPILQIDGNDIEYFEEKSVSEEKETVQEEFVCEVCGKSFSSKKALQGHNLSHKRK